ECPPALRQESLPDGKNDQNNFSVFYRGLAPSIAGSFSDKHASSSLSDKHGTTKKGRLLPLRSGLRALSGSNKEVVLYNMLAPLAPITASMIHYLVSLKNKMS
ncbi:unnamed protein product, partial [Amoebophrya sp. A25]